MVIEKSKRKRKNASFREKTTKISDVSTSDKKGYSKDNVARIYCDGIFDLFHYGHANALEQAKKLRPYVYLLVGVCNDELTLTRKGKVVMKDKERAESIRHCKWVDEVIENAPWTIDEEFLEKHQIDFVAHDDIPYTFNDVADVYAFVKETQRFLPTKRTKGVSTSDIITRIVRDYDEYIRRNLEKGVSPRELNISYLKEGQIKVQKSMSKLTKKLSNKINKSRGSIASNWSDSKRDLLIMFEAWESKSQELIKEFSRFFDFNMTVERIFKRRQNGSRDGDSPGESSSFISYYTNSEESSSD